MANLNPTVPMNIEDELKNLELYKFHPSGILNVSLNRLTDMLDGKVVLSDPSNPFTYLLETSCLNTSFAVQEFVLEARKLYPRLANKDTDLYRHMSDYDFLGRFSEPSYARVVFNVLFNDFRNKAVFDPDTGDYLLKIPRHLKVMVGGYVYLLTSAIVIRLTENEIVDIKFENQDFNNIFPIQTNYIKFEMSRANQSETYLTFALKLPEVDIEVSDTPISGITELKSVLSYNQDRKFYYFRAFHWKNDGWQEMIVTHTNEVYDVNTPTCVIKVDPTNHQVEYHIPAVYTNTKQVTGRVRFLIYTTMGKISVNFNDYQMSDFRHEYGDVFPETELDAQTQPIQNITMVAYTQDMVESGKDGKTFEELKAAVIENSIGDRQLPITPTQLSYDVDDARFQIVKYSDTLTNRTYKLETQIPEPLNRYPITKYNLDIIEFAGTLTALREASGVSTYGDDITVIPQNTLFSFDNGKLSVVSKSALQYLNSLSGISLVTEVNKSRYLALYYHYVVDTSDNRTRLRAYDLNNPEVNSISFQEFNDTARIGLNTNSVNLYKTASGFVFDILTNLTKYNVAIDYQNVTPYLVYTESSGTRFYLPGVFHTTLEDKPVYRFVIDSGYYIDHNNQIHLQGFIDANGMIASIAVGLESTLELLYVSNVIPPEYQPNSTMDSYLNGSFLAGMHAAVTLEKANFSFGHYLQHLFTANHTSVGYQAYEVYDEDVPLRYDTHVYNENNEIIHFPGDVVEVDGEVQYAFRKGNTKLDAYKQPIEISKLEVTRFLNFMFIDYRANLATSESSVAYRDQVRNFLTEVITENAETVQQKLLDNSQAYVVVPRTISDVAVKTGTGQRVISSMQDFKVDVYVTYAVYNNATIRENINYAIVKTIDDYLYANTTIKKTELLQLLYAQLKEFVVSLSFVKFTELDTEYMELVDSNSRISLDKVLNIEADGYNLVENIAIEFRIVN